MATVLIVSRDDPPDLVAGRFRGLADALRAARLEPAGCAYDEGREDEANAALGRCDAVLAFVNPLQDGRSRAGLDRLLRAAAARGVRVGAHPDVIDRLGVKAVLAATRSLGWSGDAWFYRDADALRTGLPARLAGGPRVLKQNRGQSGLGVWRVERLCDDSVRVMEARDRTRAEVVSLSGFLAERCEELDRVGGFVDQAFQPRLAEGMVRCYLSGGAVVGFGWQKVRALLDPDDVPTPARTYSGPEDPCFQGLRAHGAGLGARALARPAARRGRSARVVGRRLPPGSARAGRRRQLRAVRDQRELRLAHARHGARQGRRNPAPAARRLALLMSRLEWSPCR